MENTKNNLYKYSYLIIILVGIFVSIYILIRSFSYENREPKTIALDNNLFQDDFSNNLESGIQMENVIRLNFPWSIWNLEDFNFINNTSFVFTLNQFSGDEDKLNVMNKLSIYSNQSYDIDELAYNVTNPIIMQDEKTLLFHPINSNITHVFDIETKEIIDTLDGMVYKVLSEKKQYLLIHNGMLIIQDMNTDKRQRLIYLEELNQILYDDYIKNMESGTQLPLEEIFYDTGVIIESEGQRYNFTHENIIYELPMDDSDHEDVYSFPFMNLNPWDSQISSDESKIYFKVDFGLHSSTIYSLDMNTKQINTLLEGEIIDFSSIDNDKLIIQGNIDDNDGLFIYNIQDSLIEEMISTDVHLFNMTSDGKLAYITTNASDISELRVAHYDGEELKVNNFAYISSQHIDLLQWNPSGEELFYISDNVGTSELLIFKMKTN